MRFAMVFAHNLMGKLNLEQSLNPPNRSNLFGLMLVAALVVPPPVPWAQRQHRWPQRPQWPLLPVLEWRPGATQFRTLKLAKPNMRQLNAACTPWHQRCTSGPIWGVVAPPTTKYAAYCSICAGPAGSTQCGNRRSPGGKCEDGATLFSKWTGLPNIGTALGPPH